MRSPRRQATARRRAPIARVRHRLIACSCCTVALAKIDPQSFCATHSRKVCIAKSPISILIRNSLTSFPSSSVKALQSATSFARPRLHLGALRSRSFRWPRRDPSRSPQAELPRLDPVRLSHVHVWKKFVEKLYPVIHLQLHSLTSTNLPITHAQGQGSNFKQRPAHEHQDRHQCPCCLGILAPQAQVASASAATAAALAACP